MKIIEELVKIVVLSPNYFNIAVLLGSVDEVIEFHGKFNKLFTEVAIWLRPRIIRETRREIEFENGKIQIVNSHLYIKGQSLTLICKNSELTEKKCKEYAEIEMVHLIRHGIILEFENKED